MTNFNMTLDLAKALIPNEHLIKIQKICKLDPHKTIKINQLELHNIVTELLTYRAID